MHLPSVQIQSKSLFVQFVSVFIRLCNHSTMATKNPRYVSVLEVHADELILENDWTCVYLIRKYACSAYLIHRTKCLNSPHFRRTRLIACWTMALFYSNLRHKRLPAIQVCLVIKGTASLLNIQNRTETVIISNKSVFKRLTSSRLGVNDLGSDSPTGFHFPMYNIMQPVNGVSYLSLIFPCWLGNKCARSIWLPLVNRVIPEKTIFTYFIKSNRLWSQLMETATDSGLQASQKCPFEELAVTLSKTFPGSHTP